MKWERRGSRCCGGRRGRGGVRRRIKEVASDECRKQSRDEHVEQGEIVIPRNKKAAGAVE